MVKTIQIDSTKKYILSDCNFLEIKLTNIASQKWNYEVMTIETEQVGNDLHD
jgi:hypothetical protein